MTLEMFNFSQFKLKNLNKDKEKTKKKDIFFYIPEFLVEPLKLHNHRTISFAKKRKRYIWVSFELRNNIFVD